MISRLGGDPKLRRSASYTGVGIPGSAYLAVAGRESEGLAGRSGGKVLTPYS